MSLTIPAFSQYQAPMPPLRGLWNKPPPEGDKFCNAEIDWITTTGGANAVQFSLSGNSPVALSQIVAIFVDNSRSGADVAFIFPDSGFSIVVSAHNQVMAPVLTNALMFYVSAPNAGAGDVTVLQVLNSMPPPIPIAPSVVQNHAGVTGVALGNGSTVVVPSGVNGTLNTFSVSGQAGAGSTAGSFTLSLSDGTGKLLWVGAFEVPASAAQPIAANVTGLDLRFTSGINAVISNSTNIASGVLGLNVYYSTP